MYWFIYNLAFCASAINIAIRLIQSTVPKYSLSFRVHTSTFQKDRKMAKQKLCYYSCCFEILKKKIKIVTLVFFAHNFFSPKQGVKKRNPYSRFHNIGRYSTINLFRRFVCELSSLSFLKGAILEDLITNKG